MKKAKILSLALAAVLLCGCIIGFLTVGASAEGTTWVVDGNATDAENNTYETLQAALDAAALADWSEGDALTISITATAAQVVERSEDGVIFDVSTIWRGVGKKLPITITGGTLDFTTNIRAKENKAFKSFFTNDYTFRNTTITSIYKGNYKESV